mgnify:CR=1 FL=1
MRLILLAVVAWSASGCTTIKPVDGVRQTAVPTAFSHELLDRVLVTHVNEDGRVDYAALKAAPGDLDAYYLQLSRYSPDSHPDLFPSREARLAYWINAYNAAILKVVISHYPIAGVADVMPPAILFFMPEKSGFFLLQRVVFGGDATSLYSLENDLIRARFAEPRIHFALNCASIGCPRLPRRAFTAANLDAELDRETRRFLAEARNLRVDSTARRIYLSPLFDWYENDYLDWLAEQSGGGPVGLLDYIALYAPEGTRLADGEGPYQVEFLDYDWGLNDQAAAD